MEKIKFIYADLHKAPDKEGSILLATVGTSRDLLKYNLKFKEGESFWFWTDNLPGDPLVFKAKTRFSSDSNCWVADYDFDSVKPLSRSELRGEYSAEEVTGGREQG
jgi:hypothetical protein